MLMGWLCSSCRLVEQHYCGVVVISAATGAYQVTSLPTRTLSTNCHISTTSNSSIASPNIKMRRRRRRRAMEIRVSRSESASKSDAKIANLSASRMERFILPNFDDGRGRIYPISEFLTHPAAVEAVLNTNSFQSFQPLDSNTYRCTLPGIQFLNFEVAPVLDLRVTSTSEDCIVEMLSCKFEGSEAMQRYNDHFSAFMKNRITWDADASEPCLDIDVKVDISLEIYTKPFTLLPVSAVETPGNLLMQSLVDRLVPQLLQQLLQDYEKWVQEKCEVSS